MQNIQGNTGRNFLEPYLQNWIKSNEKANTIASETELLSFMVLEDDEPIKESVVSDLKERGYQAKGISSFLQMTKLIKKMHPTVLVVDYFLPEKNGIEIFEELAKKKTFTESVFVLMSAHSQARLLAENRGIPYLEKPFAVDELVDKAMIAMSSRVFPNSSPRHLLGEIKELFTTDV